MVPPRLPDEAGPPHPYYPCPRCGREVATRFKGFRVEHLRHVGWQLFRPATYVGWCGHVQEVIPMPLPDGHVTFVPVLGEWTEGDCAFNTSDLLAPVHTLREAETEPLNIEWTRVHNGG